MVFTHVKNEEKQQFKYIVYFIRSIIHYFCITTSFLLLFDRFCNSYSVISCQLLVQLFFEGFQ